MRKEAAGIFFNTIIHDRVTSEDFSIISVLYRFICKQHVYAFIAAVHNFYTGPCLGKSRGKEIKQNLGLRFFSEENSKIVSDKNPKYDNESLL